jgi:hypothetical protein
VQIAMGVQVRGATGGTNFQEEAKTISVSAHGCMVRLAAKVARGQHVTIVNKKTAQELSCTVSYIGQTDGEKVEVGIEFSEPSPVFWRIAFPLFCKSTGISPPKSKGHGGSAPRRISLQASRRFK